MWRARLQEGANAGCANNVQTRGELAGACFSELLLLLGVRVDEGVEQGVLQLHDNNVLPRLLLQLLLLLLLMIVLVVRVVRQRRAA